MVLINKLGLIYQNDITIARLQWALQYEGIIVGFKWERIKKEVREWKKLSPLIEELTKSSFEGGL